MFGANGIFDAYIKHAFGLRDEQEQDEHPHWNGKETPVDVLVIP